MYVDGLIQKMRDVFTGYG